MKIKRFLSRALWMEALYEAFPNRFTLWLWRRAVDRLKAERDRGNVKCAPGFRSSFSSFIGSLTGPARKARRAQQRAYDHQQFMAAAGLLQSGIAQRSAYQNAAYTQSSAFSQVQNASNAYANLAGLGKL